MSNAEGIVYKTNTGKKYHTKQCQYGYIEIKLRDAVKTLSPCSKCRPPYLTQPMSNSTRLELSTNITDFHMEESGISFLSHPYSDNLGTNTLSTIAHNSSNLNIEEIVNKIVEERIRELEARHKKEIDSIKTKFTQRQIELENAVKELKKINEEVTRLKKEKKERKSITEVSRKFVSDLCESHKNLERISNILSDSKKKLDFSTNKKLIEKSTYNVNQTTQSSTAKFDFRNFQSTFNKQRKDSKKLNIKNDCYIMPSNFTSHIQIFKSIDSISSSITESHIRIRNKF
jgi:hypothetical protein